MGSGRDSAHGGAAPVTRAPSLGAAIRMRIIAPNIAPRDGILGSCEFGPVTCDASSVAVRSVARPEPNQD